ncbi:MAG: ABC transporter substrate-binding protein [Thaumarchaeota archaeon]|nr:ABC transporter substrate-binding protein [Nitrososphaerota archaeon]
MDKWRLGTFALGAVVTTIVFTSFIFLQQASPAQQIARAPKPAQTLERFKVSGWSASADFPITAGGKEQDIWTRNGLDPEWVYVGNRLTVVSDIKEQLASGIKIGLNTPNGLVLGRFNGLPVKIVAGYYGEPITKLFTAADGPIKTMSDLEGKRIGVLSEADFTYALATYVIPNKFGIKAEVVPVGNLTNQVVALKLGRIHAFISAEGAALRLVDSGELRIVVHIRDVLPKPYTSLVIWASDDLIETNPDIVRRFVKATLETIKYMKENPDYAADLWVRMTNSPKDLADKVVAQDNWAPNGRGSGQDLVAAVTNVWQLYKSVGRNPANVDVRIEDVVDVRFLP